jgi:hypothetical protein
MGIFTALLAQLKLILYIASSDGDTHAVMHSWVGRERTSHTVPVACI